MPRPRISQERLKENFFALASISSPSRREGEVARWIREQFSRLGAEFLEDSASELTGSDTNNLIVRLEGSRDCPALMLNAHMDMVEPADGVRPIFENGVFRSDGTTVLGADDKAAIAIILEALEAAGEAGLELPPLDLVFTVCEEIGLLGAKALDTSLLRAEAGYALDSTEPFQLINRAPQAVRFVIEVHGRAAHAGIEPEKGINAILEAAKALKDIPSGRIDSETTCNIGVIRGGQATNIVPGLVTIEGEVRSHDPEKLKKIQDEIIGAFHSRIGPEEPGQGLPKVVSQVDEDYPRMSIPEDHPLVTTARAAAERLGRRLSVASTGGGSDANIFNGKGIATVIVGIGMRKVHSTDEYIRLSDMADSAALVAELMDLWGRSS